MSADIPNNEVTEADLSEWYRLKKELGKLKSAEALLRMKIFRGYFPDPKEGTNKVALEGGTGALLKAVHPVNRAVDIGSLYGLRAAMEEPGSNLPKLNLGDLIKWKPEVVIKEYRTLTEEERNVFDQCLIIKDGSPQLTIEIPKSTKAS